MRLSHRRYLLALASVRVAASAVVTPPPRLKAVVPTQFGQIGVNPVTIFGPEEQYIAPVGTNNPVLQVENGETKWIGSNTVAFGTATVTRTADHETVTDIVPVQASASTATAAADGMSPGDVSLTLTPALKDALETFSESAVQACSLVVKVKRDERNVEVATEAFSDCLVGEAVNAMRPGGSLDGVFEGVDFGSFPSPPATADAMMEKWAETWPAIYQIAKNQMRKKETWALTVVLTSYFATGKVDFSYKLPAQPTAVVSMSSSASSTFGCPPGAPTGANAPVCADDDCQGVPVLEVCALGPWKFCDCLPRLKVHEPGVVIPSWLVQQNELLLDLVNGPSTEIYCELRNKTGFDGKPMFDPPEWCLCRDTIIQTHSPSFYGLLPSPTAPCGYTDFLEDGKGITVTTRQKESTITSCRTFTDTATSPAVTGCTCNNDQEYDLVTWTDGGCDYYPSVYGQPELPVTQSSETVPTPNTNMPAPTPIGHKPPVQQTNLGLLSCMPWHEGWYMPVGVAEKAIDQFCRLWDEGPVWLVGPFPAGQQIGLDIQIQDAENGPPKVYYVHFMIQYTGGENCPTLEIGGKDRSPLCKDIFRNTIIQNCDLDTSNNGFKQGGRFERDCLQWNMARGCRVNVQPDCIFN